jgi:hypothetical protein
LPGKGVPCADKAVRSLLIGIKIKDHGYWLLVKENRLMVKSFLPGRRMVVPLH